MAKTNGVVKPGIHRLFRRFPGTENSRLLTDISPPIAREAYGKLRSGTTQCQ
ncbi:MAG: hypothetical protein K5905_17190 [Roseibium sp.]|uniref:hypothetical protein n=1 Tax=Roseibium sp. TaxID=1936156 RepID=UPI00262AB8FD|nr:hypothetical protein [Roseibium sp.]MCV0427199.1 hypothetical protein [Roseibium sp.]